GLVTRMTNLAGPPGVEACCGASRAAGATGVPALSLRGGRQGSRPPPGASAAGRVTRMRVGIADGFVVQIARHRVSDRWDRRIDGSVGLRLDRLVGLRVTARVGHLAWDRVGWHGLRCVRDPRIDLVHAVLHGALRAGAASMRIAY